jgi:hypothetical protein
LTNRRIIFTGEKSNKTLSLKQILDFEVYTNGVEIKKSTGKNPFLSFEDDTEIFSMILGKLLDESE